MQIEWGPVVPLDNPTHYSWRVIVDYAGEYHGVPLVKEVRNYQRPPKQKDFLLTGTCTVTEIRPLESPPDPREFEVSSVGATPLAEAAAPQRSYWWVLVLAFGAAMIFAAYVRRRRNA
jgi:hypothetical protein